MEVSAKSKTLRVKARWGKTWRDTEKAPLRTTNQNEMTRKKKKKGEKQETHRDLLESLTKKKKANKRIQSTLEGEKKKRTFLWFCFCVFFCPSHQKKTIRSCAMISTLVYVCALIPHTQRRAKRSTRKQKKRDEITPSITSITTQQKRNQLSLSFVLTLSML